MTAADSTGSLLLSIAVLGAIVLVWGAWRIWRAGNRQKALLMLAAAVVVLGNVLIWTVPMSR